MSNKWLKEICSHGRGPVTGIEYAWMRYYRRPVTRLFRKRIREQCCYCGKARWIS